MLFDDQELRPDPIDYSDFIPWTNFTYHEEIYDKEDIYNKWLDYSEEDNYDYES